MSPVAESIPVKRVYEPPTQADGTRVLVDRLWPRGLSKAEAHIDLWLKEIAPSTELRKWFHSDMQQWDEFRRRYRDELDGNPAVAQLRDLAGNGRVTLLYAARGEDHNHAKVLAEYLREKR